MSTKIASLFLLACALPACAGSGAQTKPTLGYSDGRYYAVRHELPSSTPTPSGQWHEDTGHINGSVCGLDVDFYGDRWGSRFDISGFVSRSPRLGQATGASPLRFDVRDGAKGRQIFGTFGTVGRTLLPIEVYLKPDSLVGTVGLRHYKLERVAGRDELRGTLVAPTFMGDRTMPFVVRGVDELLRMPASDQAVLLPLMLSCLQGMPGDRRGESYVLGVDFHNRRPPSHVTDGTRG